MTVSGPNCLRPANPQVVAWPAQGLPAARTQILGVRNIGGPVTVRPGERDIPTKREPLYKPLAPRTVGKPQKAANSDEPMTLPLAPSRVFFLIGIFMLGMLVLLPVWNAVALKHDEAYMFFLGDTFPDIILIICFSTLGLYAFTICCLARCSGASWWNDDTMITVGACFVTLLGLAMLAVASPMRAACSAVVRDVWSNCRFGPSTRELVTASASLQVLRAQPACSGAESVEQCAGYVQTSASAALKAMELQWKCSGFCYEPPDNGPDSAAAAFRDALHLPLCSDGAPPPCETMPRPHTLFSLEEHLVSCDGTAARDINSIGSDVTEQLFLEGAMLVTIPVIVGFLRIFGASCAGGEEALGVRLCHSQPPHYGAASTPGDHSTA